MSSDPVRARPYDAVLCDVDGVLRHWPPAGALERAHGLPEGALAAAAFAEARLAPAVTGAVTDEQWRAAVAGDLAAVCGSPDRARAAVAAWSALEARLDTEVVALLAAARAVVPLVLVTNATTRLDADLARLGLTGLASAVVNSSGIGFAKPHPRVYEVAAARAGVPPGRCLFVDDTEANVDGARAAGMTGLWFRRRADLREALAPLLSG